MLARTTLSVVSPILVRFFFPRLTRVGKVAGSPLTSTTVQRGFSRSRYQSSRTSKLARALTGAQLGDEGCSLLRGSVSEMKKVILTFFTLDLSHEDLLLERSKGSSEISDGYLISSNGDECNESSESK